MKDLLEDILNGFGFKQIKQSKENLRYPRTLIILKNLNRPQTLHVVNVTEMNCDLSCGTGKIDDDLIKIIEQESGKVINTYSYEMLKILALMLCHMDFKNDA